MKVDEIKPFGKKIDVLVKAVEKQEPREVVARLDNTTHRVSEALVGDETGCILLTLWDDTINQVEGGKTYQVTNGYSTTFKNSLRLNIGRYGKIGESTEEISKANKENNLSEKELSG
ncbi:MAG: hypothetical protein JW744_00355 [Candidatus Diapherotrites archaeon]|uniref:Single-stranded DNA binding protein Ssb-like OB fold domain-containing protein n=1 Tax=Candidatus Iainarchaeum sp. TaxID=3101447 RepID=A0A939C465_9ARCH|nr:hypothetical protein [Candidatus Diapherotrites archaeon]